MWNNYFEPQNINAYPQFNEQKFRLDNVKTDNDFLLGNSYIDDDSLVFHNTSDEININCDSACSDCMTCMKANFGVYQNCFRSCDRCKYCHLKSHNYQQTRDPPNYDRHPMVMSSPLLLPLVRPYQLENQLSDTNQLFPPSLASSSSAHSASKNKAIKGWMPFSKTNLNYSANFPTNPVTVRYNKDVNIGQYPAWPKFNLNGVCGPKIEDEYKIQYSNYKECQRCQSNNTCWSEMEKKCVACEKNELLKSCEMKFGCENPFNPTLPHVAPKNPLYTDCRPCWHSLK